MENSHASPSSPPPGRRALLAGLCLGGAALASCLGCGGRGDGSWLRSDRGQGFTLSAGPSSLEIPSGGSGYLMVSANRFGDFAGAIALGIPGLPSGVTASGTIPAGVSSGRMTVAVAGGFPEQSLGTLPIQGVSENLKGTTTLTLRILAALPSSTLSADAVQAASTIQTVGGLQNTSVAMEPVAAIPSKNSTGTVEVRHGFQPTSPSTAP